MMKSWVNNCATRTVAHKHMIHNNLLTDCRPCIRAAPYKRYRKYTGVNSLYGTDFDVAVGPVDSVVCHALQSK